MKNPHDYSGSRSRAATRLRTSIVMAERKKDEQLGVAQEDSGRRGGGEEMFTATGYLLEEVVGLKILLGARARAGGPGTSWAWCKPKQNKTRQQN